MTFKENDYNDTQILCVLIPPEMEDTPREALTSMIFIPFIGLAFNHIGRVLSTHNIRTV
jgi:hypothetical protein